MLESELKIMQKYSRLDLSSEESRLSPLYSACLSEKTNLYLQTLEATSNQHP